ncbi:hypothetical protein [Evansella tamaricis]|uniref:NADH dehydrogenase subunit 4 n=1 Tax=Evansella tamaricis TaxID=2069301 RepID=A0ABS6JFT9_9BACI|nr:hypothetical protein [Evansella tamaricis]MBU9712561.1 hypothetical protein [Evansella tamaricis]
METKRSALIINIVCNLLFVFSLMPWFLVVMAGLMSIANMDSFFNLVAFLFFFLLLYIPLMITSTVLSWIYYFKMQYTKSYKWLCVPFIHIVLFILIFMIGLSLE